MIIIIFFISSVCLSWEISFSENKRVRLDQVMLLIYILILVMGAIYNIFFEDKYQLNNSISCKELVPYFLGVISSITFLYIVKKLKKIMNKYLFFIILLIFTIYLSVILPIKYYNGAQYLEYYMSFIFSFYCFTFLLLSYRSHFISLRNWLNIW